MFRRTILPPTAGHSEASRFFETVMTSYKITRCLNTKHFTLDYHCLINIRYRESRTVLQPAHVRSQRTFRNQTSYQNRTVADAVTCGVSKRSAYPQWPLEWPKSRGVFLRPFEGGDSSERTEHEPMLWVYHNRKLALIFLNRLPK